MPFNIIIFNSIKWLIRVLTSPFKITRTMELLYAFDWAWFAITSFLPEEMTQNTNIDRFRSVADPIVISLVLLGIAIVSAYSLIANIIILRKILLLFNLALILFLAANSLFRLPINTNVGYLLVLAALTILAYWRIDVN